MAASNKPSFGRPLQGIPRMEGRNQSAASFGIWPSAFTWCSLLLWPQSVRESPLHPDTTQKLRMIPIVSQYQEGQYVYSKH